MPDALAKLTAALADRYRIERQLGQGGMATVYLAHDLKHDRKVALKVLKPELAAVLGGERFVVEIKTTASLQHPHILPLFDSGTAGGELAPDGRTMNSPFLYYVMPFIDGETLRARLDRDTQLGIDEAVRITTAVADALDYAHRHGVIHRDIKPENILLHDGRPMVADFGIALALSAAAGGRMTETGLSLGTPHYMSPEQATAEKELTPRSDIYSLASVLYEMLTGNPPHVGASAQQIIMKIVTEEAAPVTAVRKSVPPNVADAVAKALEKLPADRFATAAEFAAALTSTSYTRPMAGVALAAGPATARWRRLGLAGWALAGVLLLAGVWTRFRPAPPAPISKYEITFPADQVPDGVMTLSPDGSHLVYSGPSANGEGQLWVKDRAEAAAVPLPGTEGTDGAAVSADGQWIAFTQAGLVKKIPVGGGAAVSLGDSTWGALPAWLDDGSVLYTRPDLSMGRVAAGGGAPSIAWRVPDSLAGRAGAFLMASLPGARGAIFSYCTNLCAGSSLWALDLKSGAAKEVVPDARRGWYLPTGHLVYVRANGEMFAVPFDLKRLETRGTPVPIQGNVALAFGIVPNLAFSANGTLVMQSGNGGPLAGTYEMVWVDRTGRETPLDSSWVFRLSSSNTNVGWSLAPDGKRLAIGLNTPSGDDIWIKELPAGPLMKITQDSASEERPRWTPDGQSVTYIVDGAGSLRRRLANGTGNEETLLNTPGVNLLEGSYSRTGAWLLIRVGGNAGAGRVRNILAMRPGVDSTPVELLANSQADESAPALSPDGKWLAYVSDESGRDEVYIRPFPNVDSGKWQVSTNGAQAPLWAHSGRELFYVDAERNMMAVAVPTAGPSQLGARVRLFQLGRGLYLEPQEFYTPFDISPDDRRFLMAREVVRGKTTQATFLLVENWFEEVKARVAGK